MTPPAGLPDLLARRSHAARSDAIRDILAAGSTPGTLSLAGGLPSPDTFPLAALGEAVQWVFATRPEAALQYAPTEGLPEMRDALAKLASRSGAATARDDVLVTSGSQQGLALVADTLLDEGDVVALDDPSYLGAVQSFRRAGAQLLPIAGDQHGMNTDLFEARLAAGVRVKLVYVVPHFHNPTGVVLSADRKLHLARLAERYGFLILEDDPYADLSFTGKRQPSVDVHSDRVIRLMSLSKTLCPGLRVGGLKAPATLLRELVNAKQSADLQTNTLGQHILARLLGDEAFLPDHVAMLQRFYRCRAEVFSGFMRSALPWLEFAEPLGGLFFWCTVTHPALDAGRLYAAGIDRGVAVVPGAPFAIGQDASRRLRLSYATLSDAELAEAVQRLAAAADDLL